MVARKALSLAGAAVPCALATLLVVSCTAAVFYAAVLIRHRRERGPRRRAAHSPTGPGLQSAVTVEEIHRRLQREAARRPRAVGVQPRARSTILPPPPENAPDRHRRDRR